MGAILVNTAALTRAVGVLLLVAACAASAQPAEAPPSPPDPSALSADWWEYFRDAGEELGERTEAFQAALDEREASLEAAGERELRLRRLLTDLRDLSSRHVDVLERQPPAAAPTPETKQSYSIEELLSVSADQREAGFVRDLEQQDIQRNNRLLKRSAKRIENEKAAYLALAPAAPQRLEAGLELMRSRFLQAINQADLELRRAGLERATEREEFATAELERAKANLQVTSEAQREWSERAQRASAEEQRLESEAATLRLRASAFGDGLEESARRRRLEQRLIEFEARIVSAHLDELQATLASLLAAHLRSPDTSDGEALRAARRDLDEALNSLGDSLEVWRRATEREREAATAQLANADGDATLADLHRTRLARADESSQHINAVARQAHQNRTLSGVARAALVEQGGWTTDVLQRSGDALQAGWTDFTDWSTQSLFSLNETPVTPVGLVRVAIILVVAWWASHFLRKGLDRLAHSRGTMNRAALYTLGRLSHYTLLIIGLMIALSSIGLDFTKFALFVSALGVGLGFGLQAIFSNFVAGLIILFERSLKVGDFVELESGVHGEVREINIRGTLITTNDNIDILVPNAEFVSGRVTNWTLREAHRRLRIPFGVAYGSDKDLVRKAVLEAAEAVPFTLQNTPDRDAQVWLVALGNSSLDFELVVWLTQDAVKRPGRVAAAYTWAIESALREYDIEIPFPQRDINVRSWFGQKDADGLEAVRELAKPAASDPTR